MVNINTSTVMNVADVEHKLRTGKEQCLGIFATLPISDLPQQIIINLVQFAVIWLNALTNHSGISCKWSPHELICHHRLDAEKHCKIPFGAYCEVHDEPPLTNSMVPWMHPYIAIGPSGNIQGSYKFFFLTLEKKITWQAFTELPMSKSILSI